MGSVSELMCNQGIATFRYEFTYMSEGRKAPDSPRRLVARVREAVAEARAVGGKLPLVAGGKSMGGRMTSVAAAEEELEGVRGLVFLGFPIHAPGKAATSGLGRAEHLLRLDLPMLFVQGTRDRLAEMTLVEKLCSTLGRRATLHVVDGGDHSFNVLKRSGRDQSEVYGEIAEAVSSWINKVV
jgi:predicted alpha/beta-hydrolase family hydrolase